MDHGSVLVKFQAEGKIFEITRTIHSNSDRSEQFLITECFFLLVSYIYSRLQNRSEQEIKIGPGKFAKKNKHRALNIHRAYKIWKKNTLPVKMFGPFWSVWCKMALAEVGGSLP